jgi:hypothetical protein
MLLLLLSAPSPPTPFFFYPHDSQVTVANEGSDD